MDLKNKVVVITGSSRGIGKETALLFASEGAKIVVNYNNNKKEGEMVVHKIKENGGEAGLIQADISNYHEVKQLFKRAVEAFGTVNILINNAGIVKQIPFLEQTPTDWEEQFGTNVFGLAYCCQEAIKIMSKNKSGKIINVSSIRALEQCASPRNVSYSASKAAVSNITKSLSKELAPNILVNAVAPGYTETEMAKTWGPASKKSAIEGTPIHRLVQPIEIAQGILFLVKNDALNGEILVIDGGNNKNQFIRELSTDFVRGLNHTPVLII